MLETMCSEFKAYHYEIVAGLETDEAAARGQVVFDEHQKKTMEFIDRLGALLVKPQPDVPFPLSTNNRLADRQLGYFEDSAKDIRIAVETPGIGRHVQTNYLIKIASLEGEL